MKCAVDKLINQHHLLGGLGKIGLVVNQTSATSDYQSTVDVVVHALRFVKDSSLVAIFGPQHGYGQTEQDNMRETPDSFFLLADGSKLPLFSLYSQTREPTSEQLEMVDTLLVDLQDIGCRIYTYMLTLAGCLRQAARFGKRVVVLDRCNPLGMMVSQGGGSSVWSGVEGDRLQTRWHSFVGWYDIPMRHGLTMGELGLYFIQQDKLDVDYKVIPVEGLSRDTSLKKMRRLSWTMPSPNIPDWESALFFPSFVALEATNVSEGRGTTLPFQLVGAPWLDARKCRTFLKENEHLYKYEEGSPLDLALRLHDFRPTFNKHMGLVCQGLQFHVTSAGENLDLFALGMTFLLYCVSHHPKDFVWLGPGYEYNFTDMPIHLVLGTDRWFSFFESQRGKNPDIKDFGHLLAESRASAQSFAKGVSSCLLYT